MQIRRYLPDAPPPGRKVGLATLAGAITVVLTWFAQQFYQVEIPGYVGSAITTIISAAVGYMVPSAE